MPKGKKFDAAEKHFEKKCRGWKEKIRELEEVNAQLHKKIIVLNLRSCKWKMNI